ncbi:MAG: hypothetical protein M1830_001450 [Pleopsidium flavum]|nr:MAG: hypothetical protein M1830_001450 [Pleopsidium flavum]
MSMVQTYQPPLMEVAHDTLPELQPIFTFLNSHSNKLYQEGYFLKLNDLDSQGRPNADRTWTECFAQLVGTILSLWDAAALDAAGKDGEVAPTFINLADASIKMIETLPTRSQDAQPLQNVLSISTAGKNRYLLHFNSLHSLTQWTAGIRLAMFEHATLQEAYTGSLVAGKGKQLNNIRVIMDRTKLKTEDWARVRFGAGTPWRRCWCVISPPDEKDVQRQQKSLKKKSAYDRPDPTPKGDIKFYDTKKIKKAQPIATITDAYSAYAIYPQSKPLIDQSTLVKLEGTITIHSNPLSTTEGFVFVMPEVHPAVTGFEMMLRWLFPVYDIFGLYGRPNRLIADTLDVRSLMFAMPQERRYGYLEILDVAGLIHTDGSQEWTEKEWRKRLKEVTGKRITTLQSNASRQASRIGSRRSRTSLPSRNGNLRFDDAASVQSSPSMRHHNSGSEAPTLATTQKNGSIPTGNGPLPPPHGLIYHQRSVSETLGFSTPRHQRSVPEAQGYTPSRLSYEATPSRPSYEANPPPPPVHSTPVGTVYGNEAVQKYDAELDGANERSSSEGESRFRSTEHSEAQELQQELGSNPPPAPVMAPPAFVHEPGAKPLTRPYHSPELRRANSRMSSTTLSQLADSSNVAGANAVAAAGATAAWRGNGQQMEERYTEDQGQRGVIDDANKTATSADHTSAHEGLVLTDVESQLLPVPTSLESHGSPSSSQNLNDRPPVPTHEQPLQSQPPQRTPAYPSPISAPSIHDVFRTTRSQPAAPPGEHGFDASAVGFVPPPIPREPERPVYASRLSTSQSITRKPLPDQVQKPKVSEPATPASKSSVGSLREHAIDQDALDKIIAQVPTEFSEGGDQNMYRRSSDEVSNYDNDSLASPDYASTRKSTETKRSAVSVEKPRAGVLKTVGTVEPPKKEVVVVGDVHYQPDVVKQSENSNIPNIDFGPTYAYTAGTRSRPGTSGAMTQPPHNRSGSEDRLGARAYQGGSPGQVKRNSYGFSGRVDSGQGGKSREHSRSPSRNLTTPESDPYRSASAGPEVDGRRSVAWQPGTAIGGGGTAGRQVLTPEQFVQQRAAANRITPVYAHQRNKSGTPPQTSRSNSADWSAQQHAHHPSLSKEVPPRPQSRGSPAMLNNNLVNTAADYTAHLSAREQEHVARVTGSPLIQRAGNTPNMSGPQGGGLVGAIEAREREKREMKEGLSGQMVQHAIAQRQQQAQEYQYAQQAFPSPSPQLNIPGQYPQTPGRVQSQYGGWGQPQQYAQGQQWVSPAAQLYWSTSTPASPYQQQGQYSQQHQQQYGPYFGNGPQGRPG